MNDITRIGKCVIMHVCGFVLNHEVILCVTRSYFKVSGDETNMYTGQAKVIRSDGLKLT